MPARSYEFRGFRIFECAAEGAALRSDRDAVEVIGAALEHRGNLIVIPTQRLGEAFFDLSTRIAGEVLQKFVTYHMPVAIMGDISDYVAKSSALRDFVYESNRGKDIWFVASVEELERRLEGRAGESC